MNGNGDNGRNGLARVAIRCQSDSRLAKLVREGHDLAFDEVVRRYRPQLVAYAAAIVPEHHAEDVVQEALTRAHTALGRNDSEMRLRPWLYTIVRNGALNALRDEPVHTHLDENYDGVPQPPEVAARREELAELTASVNDLPDQQREALVKRELEGRSHEEIGVSLGVSAGAVRGLIYRARATLRDGAGMVIPLPVLRALLSSSQATPETTGAAAAAAGLAGGGGGIALKAGATLGVAVIAVGSGIAVQHRDSGSAKDPATGAAPVHSARADGTGGSGGGVRLADAALPGGRASGQEGEGSPSSGPGGGRDGSSGSSSGPGSGGHSGGGGSPGPGPGTDHGGHSGSGSGGDDGTGSSSGPGGGGSGDDGGGSTTSGHGGSGSSGSGGGDDGTSGGGGGEISGHGGGSSGSGSSGSGGDGGGTSGGSSGDDGSSGSGSGSGGSGSGDDGGSTTTATTTTDGGGGGGTSGGSD
jgi:RNA polymerase sigma factor (sigma-70 family)